MTEALSIQIKELEKRVDREATSVDRALVKQATEYERRLEAADSLAGRLETRIAYLENYRHNIEGRIWGVSLAVGAVVTLVNLGIVVLVK